MQQVQTDFVHASKAPSHVHRPRRYYAVMTIGWEDEANLEQRLFKSKRRALAKIAEMVNESMREDLEVMDEEGVEEYEPLTLKGLKQWKKDAKENVILDDYVEYIDSDGVRYKVVPMYSA
jgi:hypothetical protein